MKDNQPQIKIGEHHIIAGMTGSGKSVLAEKYASLYPFVACLDTKGTVTMPSVPKEEVTLVTSIYDLPQVQTPRIIYRPRWEEMTPDIYNAFYKWCYDRGNTAVWTDEIFGVCESPLKYPPYLKAIMTRGRDLPQGSVIHIGCTQRPTGIPVVTVSESTHYWIFRLNTLDDRKKIVGISGCEDFLNNPPEFNFQYWNAKKPNPAVMGKLKI